MKLRGIYSQGARNKKVKVQGRQPGEDENVEKACGRGEGESD